MLPFRVFFKPAPASAITIAYFAASGNAPGATSLNCPASIVAGDLICLLDVSVNVGGSIPAAVTPAGWTRGGTQGDNFGPGSQIRSSIEWKEAVGTEGGTSISGMESDASFTDKGILVFRPSGGSLWTPSSYQGDNDSLTPMIPTLTAPAAPCIILAVGQDFGFGSGLAMNPTADATVTNGTLQGGYKIYNSSPANNSPTLDAGTGGSLMGIAFRRT